MNEWLSARLTQRKDIVERYFCSPQRQGAMGGWACRRVCVRRKCSAFEADTNYAWLFYHLGEIAKISWMVNKRHILLLALALLVLLQLFLLLLFLLIFVCFVRLFAWLYICICIRLFAQSHTNIHMYILLCGDACAIVCAAQHTKIQENAKAAADICCYYLYSGIKAMSMFNNNTHRYILYTYVHKEVK